VFAEGLEVLARDAIEHQGLPNFRPPGVLERCAAVIMTAAVDHQVGRRESCPRWIWRRYGGLWNREKVIRSGVALVIVNRRRSERLKGRQGTASQVISDMGEDGIHLHVDKLMSHSSFRSREPNCR
jgi:hypothetical protein